MKNPNSASAARSRVLILCFAAGFTGACAAPGDKADGKAAADAIRQQIAKYTAAVDAADAGMASQVWRTSSDISFIHPVGHARGWEEVKKVYSLFGTLFSERKLTIRDVSVHVNGEAAWAEFYWHFAAKQSKDGSTYESDGRETQI